MLLKNDASNWFEFDIWVDVSLPEDVDQRLSINDFLHNFRFHDSRWGTFEKEDRIPCEIMKYDWGKWKVIFVATFICGSLKKNCFNTESPEI